MQEEYKKTSFISFLRANFLACETDDLVLSKNEYVVEEDVVVAVEDVEEEVVVKKTLKNIKSHLIDLNFLLSINSNLEHKIDMEKKFFKHRYKSSNPSLIDKVVYNLNHQRRLLNHSFHSWNPAMVTVGILTVFIVSMLFTVGAPSLSKKYISSIDGLIKTSQEKHFTNKGNSYAEKNEKGYLIVDINEFQKVAGVKVGDLEKAGYMLSTEKEKSLKDNFKMYVDKVSEKQKDLSLKLNDWLVDLLEG